MSQFPRRSPRLQGDRSEVHGSHSHDHAPNDVFMVDLTDGEDLTCSVCVVSLTASWANSRVAYRQCIQNVKATLVLGVMMAVRSCWQLRSVFCAGLRWQQQIVSSFRVASSVCIWSVWCAVSSFVESGALSARWTSFRWPVLNNSRRFSEGTSSSTNHFQTPSTSHRRRHHLSFSHCVATRLVDPQISFHWRIVAWSGLPFTLPVPGVLHRGHTSGCVCRVPGHFELKTSLHFPKHRAQNVNGILELSLMSPQAMSDAYAPCVAVWFLFQTHQFRRPIGSRVDHSANCPPCMVGIRPRCPSLAKAPSRGCSVHSSLWVCWLWKPDLPFGPVLHWSPGSSPRGADSVLDTPCARHHRCVCCPFLFHLP